MDKMDLFCVILFCVVSSVTMATLDQRTTVEEELASSPLIQHLIERVDALEKQCAKQASEIHSFKREMSQQSSEIQTLRAEMSPQASEIHTMRAEMSQQKAYTRQLRSKLHSKDQLIQSFLKKVSKIINSHEVPTDSGKTPAYSDMVPVAEGSKHRQQKRSPVIRIVPVENVPVAFTASLNHRQVYTSQSNITEHRVHIPIVFDMVETNVGNGYNPMNGSFIAPVSGIYVFSANVLSFENNTTHAYIKVNTHKKACMYMNADHEMAGQTMVLQLSQGDNVVIITDCPESLYGHISRPNSYTTFSGFLLYQTYPAPKGGPLFG